MKTLFITAMLAVAGVLCLYPQDRIDPSQYINSLDQNLLNLISSDETTRYVKGWNWNANTRKLDSALRMNFNHDGITENLTNYNARNFYLTGQSLLLARNGVAGGDKGYSITQAQAMHFEPSLTVDTSDYFTPLPGDNTGAVFGFLNKDANYELVQTIPHNYVLLNSIYQMVGQTGTVALSKPWSSDELIHLNTIQQSTPDSLEPQNTDATRFYLSIRLRALGDIGSELMDTTVLMLRVKYTAKRYELDTNGVWHPHYSSFLIAFDSLPREYYDPGTVYNIMDSRTQPNNLGLTRSLRVDTLGVGQLTEFSIKGNMLKSIAGAEPDPEYITLSAHFICNDSLNFFLQDEEGKGFRDFIHNLETPTTSKWKILSLEPEVVYFGGTDIAIDWIRIETPRYRELAHGAWDQAIIDEYEDLLTTINSQRPDLRIYRFYGIDEFWPSNYSSQRYLNKLLNNNLSSEIDHSDVNVSRFLYATDFKEYWKGQNKIVANRWDNTGVAAPYVRKTDFLDNNLGIIRHPTDASEYLNLSMGYCGLYYWDPNITLNRDTLNSYYESFIHREPMLFGGSALLNAVHNENIHEMSFQDQDEGTVFPYYHYTSPLMLQEHVLYKEYYKIPSTIFSEKPVWVNIWSAGNISILNQRLVWNQRPPTGEEVFEYYFKNILLGIKGHLVWYGDSQFITDANLGMLGMSMHHHHDAFPNAEPEELGFLPDGFNLLYGNDIGDDWAHATDTIRFMTEPLSTFINPAILMDSLNIINGRVYIGTKSIRTQTAKINYWVESVEEELLDLKLCAWYGNGYKDWYIQDPKIITNNLFDKIIIKDSIRTKKIWNAMNDRPQSSWEHPDSSFFDITLLRQSDDLQLLGRNLVFGVQNRRTDPLFLEDYDTWIKYYFIFNPRELKNSNVKQDIYYAQPLVYYSSAEMDMNVVRDSSYTLWNYPNYNDNRFLEPQSYWVQQWWRRLGCREFSIPIRPIYDGGYFRVTELGYDDNDLNQNFWRREDLYHMIDTSVFGDSELRIRFLPGEGKLINFERKNVVQVVGNNPQDIDSCEGCENAYKNIDVQLSPMNCNDSGYCCWDITLINHSECNYSEIGLILDGLGTDLESIITYVPERWLGKRTNLSNKGGNEYLEWKGELNMLSFATLTFCAPDTIDFSFSVKFGAIIDSILIVCDSLLVPTQIINQCCDEITVELHKDSTACPCAKCGYEIIGHFPPIEFPEDSCFNRIQVEVLEDGASKFIDSNLDFDPVNGYFFINFCSSGGDKNIKFEFRFFDDSIGVCHKELVDSCSICDTINIIKLEPNSFPHFADSCFAEFEVSLGALAGCLSHTIMNVHDESGNPIDGRGYLFGLELVPYILNYTVPEDSCLYFTFDFYDHNFDLVCSSDTLSHCCGSGIIQGIEVNVDDYLNTPFYCGNFVGLQDDTSTNEIYGISVYDPRDRFNPIAIFANDPDIDPPIDLSIPGLLLATSCAPFDSTMKVHIGFYGADSSQIYYFRYDSTYYQPQQKSWTTIGNFSAVPNPASESITFNYEILVDIVTKIEFYDRLGQLIATPLKEEFLKVGSYKLKYDLSEFHAGIYYSVIRTTIEDKVILIQILR